MKRFALFCLMLILIAAMMPLFAVIPAQSQTVASLATDMAWSPDGSLFAFSGNFGLVLNSASFQLVEVITTSNVRLLAWSPEGTLIATNSYNPNIITIWNVQSKQNIATIYINTTHAAIEILWSPDGQYIAVVTGFEIFIYETATQSLLYTLVGSSYIEDAAWSPDGIYIAAVGGGVDTPAMLHLWNAATGILDTSVDLTFSENFSDVSSLAWNNDSNLIILGGDSSASPINYFDITTKNLIFTAYGDPISPPKFIALSPDETLLASIVSDSVLDVVYVWDTSTKALLWSKYPLDNNERYLDGSWKPDSGQFALLSRASNNNIDNYTISIIDTTGNEVAILELPLPTPTSVLMGKIWTDLNQDGIHQEQETPLTGITLNLLDTNATVVQTTTTSSTGLYRFEATPGTYTVEISTSDYTLSPTNQGSDDTLDSDFDPVTNRTEPITLTASESIRLDAGLVSIPISE